jgi:hypothetical protein
LYLFPLLPANTALWLIVTLPFVYPQENVWNLPFALRYNIESSRLWVIVPDCWQI